MPSLNGAVVLITGANGGIGTQFVVTDINGDGLLDIVTANKKGVFLIEQVRATK